MPSLLRGSHKASSRRSPRCSCKLHVTKTIPKMCLLMLASSLCAPAGRMIMSACDMHRSLPPQQCIGMLSSSAALLTLSMNVDNRILTSS